MDLSRICIDPRLRNSWEAVDLGCAMARRWYLPLLLCWAIPCLLLILVIGTLLKDHWWIALVLVWWCKPLCDQLPLYFISRAIFSEPVSARQSLGQLPSLWRIDCFAKLIWRRFNATRSFDLPVSQLERLTGKQRNQRLQVLHRRNTGAALWLTLVCLPLESVVTFGLLSLAAWLIPAQADFNVFQLINAGDATAHWLTFFLMWVSMSIIAPFYVVAGFALYISRRIELEAWDVELRFRHLAAQKKYVAKPSAKPTLAQAQNPITLSTVTLLSCFALFCASPSNTYANPQQSAADSATAVSVQLDNNKQAKRLIDNILAGEDFHVMEEVTRWRIKPINTDGLVGDGLPQWFITFIEWLDLWLLSIEQEPTIDRTTLALILEIFLWCMAALAVGSIIYIYRQDLHHLIKTFKESHSETEEKPQTLFGLDVSEDSLPSDIPTQVSQLCAQGDFRQALGLLYRSTLSGLMHARGFTFYDSYTEGECVGLVQHAGDRSLSLFTEDLTRFWQRQAYGHQFPTKAEVDQLCLRWQEFFGDEK